MLSDSLLSCMSLVSDIQVCSGRRTKRVWGSLGIYGHLGQRKGHLNFRTYDTSRNPHPLHPPEGNTQIGANIRGNNYSSNHIHCVWYLFPYSTFFLLFSIAKHDFPKAFLHIYPLNQIISVDINRIQKIIKHLLVILSCPPFILNPTLEP